MKLLLSLFCALTVSHADQLMDFSDEPDSDVALPEQVEPVAAPALAPVEAAPVEALPEPIPLPEKNVPSVKAQSVEEGSGSSFLDQIKNWKKNRGLVQVPVRGSTFNVGPCGSFHYNPDRRKSQVVDNYAKPVTACVMMKVLQDWKQKCPSRKSGCRIAWGDISHMSRTKFNGHQTHTHGECIDFRPLRKGSFKNAPLTYGSSDRATTLEFIALARQNGGQPIYYNDPKARKVGARYAGGHENHIHICFKDNKKTREICNNFKYNADVCGPEM